MNQYGEKRSRKDVAIFVYWDIVRRYIKSIIAIVIVASIVAVVVSLFLPLKYKSKATIIPLTAQKGGMMGNMAAQMDGLAALAGLGADAGGDTLKLMAILQSRTLAENVIKEQNLLPILFTESEIENDVGKGVVVNMEQAVLRFREKVEVFNNKKDSTIEISAIFLEPPVAARVANAVTAELQSFINSNSLTVAKRNRLFIDEQLEDNQRQLLEAGKEINEFYRTKKISSVDAEVDVLVDIPDTVSALDGKASALAAVPQGPKGVASLAYSQPSDVKSDIDSLMLQKSQLEQKIASVKMVKDVPQQVYLTYLMMRRELLAKVNALLTTQYEMAKIEENREDLAFQVVDKAVPPVQRFSPARGRICVVSFMIAWVLAIALAFLRDYIRRIRVLDSHS